LKPPGREYKMTVKIGKRGRGFSLFFDRKIYLNKNVTHKINKMLLEMRGLPVNRDTKNLLYSRLKKIITEDVSINIVSRTIKEYENV